MERITNEYMWEHLVNLGVDVVASSKALVGSQVPSENRFIGWMEEGSS